MEPWSHKRPISGQLIDVSHHKRPNPFTLLHPSALEALTYDKNQEPYHPYATNPKPPQAQSKKPTMTVWQDCERESKKRGRKERRNGWDHMGQHWQKPSPAMVIANKAMKKARHATMRCKR